MTVNRMQPERDRLRRVATCRAGFSLVEAVMAMLIVSVMFVAALNTLGGSRLTQQRTNDRMRGTQMAQELLGEILARRYADPDGNAVFGLEGNESNTARIDFDDVDDYHKWSASPPVDASGSVMAGMSGWKQEVSVAFVDPDDELAEVNHDTGVKRITVTVYRGARVVGSAVALKTSGGDAN